MRSALVFFGAPVAAVFVVLGACSSEDSSGGSGNTTRDAIVNVLTLKQGAISNAKALRGTGPFHEYGVPPDAMFGLVEDALRSKVPAVWPNRHRMEVVAKEQPKGDPLDPSYADAWSSAVVVTVHPVEGAPSRSRVEVHAVAKGTFTRGSIDWERDVPRLLEAAVARGGREPIHAID